MAKLRSWHEDMKVKRSATGRSAVDNEQHDGGVLSRVAGTRLRTSCPSTFALASLALASRSASGRSSNTPFVRVHNNSIVYYRVFSDTSGTSRTAFGQKDITGEGGVAIFG